MICVIGYEKSSDTLQGNSLVDMCRKVGRALTERLPLNAPAPGRSGAKCKRDISKKTLYFISSAMPNIETSRGMIRSSRDLLF
jgi:hypothetical protein